MNDTDPNADLIGKVVTIECEDFIVTGSLWGGREYVGADSMESPRQTCLAAALLRHSLLLR